MLGANLHSPIYFDGVGLNTRTKSVRFTFFFTTDVILSENNEGLVLYFDHMNENKVQPINLLCVINTKFYIKYYINSRVITEGEIGQTWNIL